MDFKAFGLFGLVVRFFWPLYKAFFKDFFFVIVFFGGSSQGAFIGDVFFGRFHSAQARSMDGGQSTGRAAL